MTKPENPHYDFIFLTSSLQFDIIKEHFNVENLTQRGYARLLSKADFISSTVTYKGVKGRWLYIMKK